MEVSSKYTKKTKICCLNLDDGICDHFSKDFEIYNGSLGKVVDVADQNNKLNSTSLLLNYDFPDNVHEYKVFIIDLGNDDIIKSLVSR